MKEPALIDFYSNSPNCAFPSTPPLERSDLDWELLERFLEGDDSYYETILHLRG